jgi:hypothetical protein
MAVPYRLLAPRVGGDALDGQVNFDEAFGIPHGFWARKMCCLWAFFILALAMVLNCGR